MSWVLYFTVGLIISLIGSVPPGLITLNIMQRTVYKGSAAGIMVGLGAGIAEFVYPLISLLFLSFFLGENQFNQYIRILSVFVFAAMGIYYLLKKGEIVIKEEKIRTRFLYQDFGKGVILGFTNMLIIPFWVLVATLLETNEMSFGDMGLNVIFSLGALIGALIVFFLYVKLVRILISRFEKIGRWMNKIVGMLFLGTGAVSVV